MVDENLIPQVIINNSGPEMVSLSNEFVQVLLTNNTPQDLFNNLNYFETTCKHLEKESKKYSAVYLYMMQENSCFIQFNPFSIMDYIHLCSHTLIGLLKDETNLNNEESKIQETVKDVLRVLSIVANINVDDSRVANFYLLNQRIH